MVHTFPKIYDDILVREIKVLLNKKWDSLDFTNFSSCQQRRVIISTRRIIVVMSV